ncbi:MAG: sigma-70 family RNA polymerase sigma factor [Limisphaerales bacterium]
MVDSASELLRAWAERGSEEAFAELVARHIDFVYSVALRKVAGDSGLATDVAQTVFVDVARKARALKAEGSLAGWLHRHTCYTAAAALRRERRRHARERTAAAMLALEHDSSPDWSSLAPLLDDAVNALGEKDRRAVLLRFYEQRDLHAVGTMLGISDDAAQKRVSRALEKLRVWLGRCGVTSSTAALAGLLGAHSVTAAPAGTALAVTTAALAAAAAGAGTGTLTLVELMMHSKTKVAVVAAVAVALMGPLVRQEHAIARTRLDNRDRAAALEQLRLEPNVRAAQAQADAKTERAPEERGELERLRAEVATLRAQLEKARATRLATAGSAAKGGGQSARRPGFISLRETRDVGSATTEALFQTLVWAVGRGDSNRVIELVDWSAEGAQQQKEEMVHGLAGAAAYFSDTAPGSDFQFRVVRQVPLPDGDAALVVEISQEGSLERQALRVRHAGAEWRLVMFKNGQQQVDLGADLNRD